MPIPNKYRFFSWKQRRYFFTGFIIVVGITVAILYDDGLLVPGKPGRNKVAITAVSYPFSHTLKLLGPINDGQIRYLAESSNKPEYITIPAKNCKIIDGNPVCHYLGRLVTRSTGH